MTGTLVIWLVYFVVVAVIALPTDALLISLTVIATERRPGCARPADPVA